MATTTKRRLEPTEVRHFGTKLSSSSAASDVYKRQLWGQHSALTPAFDTLSAHRTDGQT